MSEDKKPLPDPIFKWGPLFAPALKIGGPAAALGFAAVNWRLSRAVFRGLSLRLRNDCHSPQFTTRTIDVDCVKQCLKHGLDYDQYLQVIGPSGVGKTSVIQNAVCRRPG